LKHDGPAGLVVFLVALPLCLGIALGSGASLFSGVISGIVGGLVVSVLSGSQVSVSGPVAGLAVIVVTATHDIGSYKGFLVAVVLSGLLQLVFGAPAARRSRRLRAQLSDQGDVGWYRLVDRSQANSACAGP